MWRKHWNGDIRMPRNLQRSAYQQKEWPSKQAIINGLRVVAILRVQEGWPIISRNSDVAIMNITAKPERS
jgi:hypothetical protein